MRLDQGCCNALSTQFPFRFRYLRMRYNTCCIKIAVQAIIFEGGNPFYTWTPGRHTQSISLLTQLLQSWTHLLQWQERLFKVNTPRLSRLCGSMTITLCIQL